MSNEGNTRFTFPGKTKESEAIMVLVIIYTSKDVRRIQTWNSVKFPSLISIMPYVHVPGTGSKSDQGQIMTDRYHWRRKMFCIGGGGGLINKNIVAQGRGILTSHQNLRELN